MAEAPAIPSVATQGFAATTDGTGVPLFVSPYADLVAKPGSVMDSWYAISRVSGGDTVFDLLNHVVIIARPDGKAISQTALSLFDHSTGAVTKRDGVTDVSNASFSAERFEVIVPEGEMRGDSSGFRLKTAFENIHVELDLAPDGVVLSNLGNGLLPFWGDINYEYGFVGMSTSGNLTVGETTHAVTGSTWFDRQWGGAGKAFWDDGRKWTWFGVMLDDGRTLSVWEMVDSVSPAVHSFATIVHPNGWHEIVSVSPLSAKAGKVYTSPDTGQKYPTYHEIDIPQVDAHLVVESLVPEQDVGRKYAGASTVQGTWGGADVTGHAVLELSGNWH